MTFLCIVLILDNCVQQLSKPSKVNKHEAKVTVVKMQPICDEPCLKQSAICSKLVAFPADLNTYLLGSNVTSSRLIEIQILEERIHSSITSLCRPRGMSKTRSKPDMCSGSRSWTLQLSTCLVSRVALNRIISRDCRPNFKTSDS